MEIFSEKQKIDAAKKIAAHLASILDERISLRLWDGSMVPLGEKVDERFYLSISGAHVIASLVKRPTLENVFRHYTSGNIDFHGGNIIEFGDILRKKSLKKRERKLKKGFLFKCILPFLFTSSNPPLSLHKYNKNATKISKSNVDNKKFIQFHYDVSNEFYALFLDPEMVYSCGYYTDWGNSLEQAQQDKLEMICRKLRLKRGEKFLDIGCGWGGLICYAAQKYGVQAYGVTLSQKQYDFAQEKIRRLGLENHVRVDLRDYSEVEGVFDKIASIGMFEHVGIANFPKYFKKIRFLLRERGIFLNHSIARHAKKSRRKFQKIRPGRRWISKYIFPGHELDHIGHTLESMEASNFEIHDVEAWREHYAKTTRSWCERLSANCEAAIKLVGSERYRIWIVYLAYVSLSFGSSLCIYQVVATKRTRHEPSGMPPTRTDIYKRSEKE